MPDAGAPMARLKQKTQAAVTTGSAEQPAGSNGRRNTWFFHSCQQFVKRLRWGFPSQRLSRSAIESCCHCG